MAPRTSLVALILAFAALAASAQTDFPKVQRKAVSGHRPFAEGATLVVDNPVGDVRVYGAAIDELRFEAVLTVRAADDAAVAEALRAMSFEVAGTADRRIIRSHGTYSGHTPRWSGAISYSIYVPRSTRVRIATINSDSIEVRNISGSVSIKNFFQAKIGIISPGTHLDVQTVNGNIGVIYTSKPTAAATLSSVNGNVDVLVPRYSSLKWHAETVKGNVFATPSIQGTSQDRNGTRMFEAKVGKEDGPALLTSTMTGTLTLIESGSRSSIRPVVPVIEAGPPSPPTEDLGSYLATVSKLLLHPPVAGEFVFQRKRLLGNLEFSTQLGNIFVGDVQGNARLSTRAGEIVVGRVFGDLSARSLGGPLNLGEIRGELDARTSAGDISIATALQRGTVYTGGGNILVRRSTGPLTLESAGGDVTVREALNSIIATTNSGDIAITVATGSEASRLEAHTVGGNVLLSIPADFGADIDATILTSDDEGYAIESELAGLTIVRERQGDRTRIQARGSINGGGRPVVVRVENGNIQLRKR